MHNLNNTDFKDACRWKQHCICVRRSEHAEKANKLFAFRLQAATHITSFFNRRATMELNTNRFKSIQYIVRTPKHPEQRCRLTKHTRTHLQPCGRSSPEHSSCESVTVHWIDCTVVFGCTGPLAQETVVAVRCVRVRVRVSSHHCRQAARVCVKGHALCVQQAYESMCDSRYRHRFDRMLSSLLRHRLG